MANIEIQKQKAMLLLENSLPYPGLPEKQAPVVLLRVWRYPSFEPYCSWAVIEDKKQYFLRRVVWDQRAERLLVPQIYGAEAKIDRGIFDSMLEKLREIKIPAFMSANTVGIDGTHYGIETGNDMISSRLSWWCEPPIEWRPLQVWHDETIKIFDVFLPASTVHL